MDGTLHLAGNTCLFASFGAAEFWLHRNLSPICPFHFRTRLKVAKEEGCQTPPTDVRANRIRNCDIQYSKHK